MPDSGVSYITWYGAILSTILAFLKIWDIWANRFRVDIGYDFASQPSQGHVIFIRNLSSKPIILQYWELHLCSNWWPFRKFEYFESPSLDIGDDKIEPYSSKKMSFKDQNYFRLSDDVIRGRKIYIKIYIVGRKPFYKKVYG